ncbi:mechanosensitive ion channel protein [Thermosipho sp. 1063]|uniref:mechanosensitive ion channel family protein n=1 Tax=unclassified Thermosipho (in: thermotogales) TaxID=2676525 RepID=UPI0009494A40|nr:MULTISPECIES: mechanosensitive ion channel family protein [unclassified Thermosipho (in: thermotogales)]ANQ53428.1 mechanosensitive ion channel protein [Thermosipho sp. 1070]APT71877.1 mechanosensitive ion channel protein [Thermosipho sp. 1063]OOC45013.1 mechanosensitive ion channel protein [Thermosipho sp. 1074]
MNTWLQNYWDKSLLSIITIIISYILYKYLIKLIYKSIKAFGKEIKAPKTVQFFIGIIIAVFAILIILSIFDIDLLPYITGLGISGIIVGLALQEPLTNFISGILVMTTRKLFEGEVVDINGITGIVDEIKINHSYLKTFDGKLVLLPNKSVWSGTVTKYWPSTVRRVNMDVGVSYDINLETVLKLLKKAIDEEPLVVKENVNNFIAFKQFGTSSIDFTVYFWVERNSYFEAINALAIRIKQIFDENKIEIPFTQIDVHMK